MSEYLKTQLIALVLLPVLMPQYWYYQLEENTRTERWYISKFINTPIVYVKYIILKKENGGEDPKFHGYLNNKNKNRYYNDKNNSRVSSNGQNLFF